MVVSRPLGYGTGWGVARGLLQHQIDLVLTHVEATDLAPEDHDRIGRHSAALADPLAAHGRGPAGGDGTPPA